MIRFNPTLHQITTIRDARKELVCSKTGVTYRALSADASTAFGRSPAFCIHDELGLVRGPRSELYEALETGSGAHESPLSVVISTQAPTDGDLLSMLIDNAKLDDKVRLILHSAPMGCDPFSEEAIRAANPAFGDFLNAEEVFALARDAEMMPSREAEFRNLILNQRVESSAPFISPGLWQSCAATAVHWLMEAREMTDRCASCEVIPVKEAGQLCWTCNKDKETFERAGLPWVPWKDRGADVDGMPLDPRHPWNNEE